MKNLILLFSLFLFVSCQSMSTRIYEIDTVGSIELDVKGAYNQYPFGGQTNFGLVLPTASIPILPEFNSNMLQERVIVRIKNVVNSIKIKLENVGNQGKVN